MHEIQISVNPLSCHPYEIQDMTHHDFTYTLLSEKKTIIGNQWSPEQKMIVTIQKKKKKNG